MHGKAAMATASEPSQDNVEAAGPTTAAAAAPPRRFATASFYNSTGAKAVPSTSGAIKVEAGVQRLLANVQQRLRDGPVEHGIYRVFPFQELAFAFIDANQQLVDLK